MTKDELIKIIQYEITCYGNLPVKLDDEDISKLIDIEMSMLYAKYSVLQETQYSVVYKEYFYTPEFKSSRLIKCPDCVIGIAQFREINKFGALTFGLGYGDVGGAGVANIGASMYMSPWSIDGVTYRMSRLSVVDLYKQLTTSAIQFGFSEATHTISVNGRTPKHDVLIEAICCIPLADAYSDPWVRRYLIGKAKQQLGRVIGFYNAQLVGGATINVSIINEDAKAEMDACDTYFKEINAPCYFAMF